MSAQPGRQAKQSAVISYATLHEQRGQIERITAIVVLIISFVGSVAALTPGGWGVLLAGQWSWGGIAFGVLIQALLTFFEWHYHDNWLLSWAARVVDAWLTAWGYGPLVVVGLTVWLAGRGITEAFWVAWAIIGLVSLGIAWYPEDRLVD